MGIDAPGSGEVKMNFFLHVDPKNYTSLMVRMLINVMKGQIANKITKQMHGFLPFGWIKGGKRQITHSAFCPSAVASSRLCLCFSVSPILQFYSPYLITHQRRCLHCTNGTHSCYQNIDEVIVLHVFTIYISYMTFCAKCGLLSFTFCFSWRD